MIKSLLVAVENISTLAKGKLFEGLKNSGDSGFLISLAKDMFSEGLAKPFDVAVGYLSKKNIEEVKVFCKDVLIEADRVGGLISCEKNTFRSSKKLINVCLGSRVLSEQFTQAIKEEFDVDVLETFGNRTITIIKTIAYKPHTILVSIDTADLEGRRMIHSLTTRLNTRVLALTQDEHEGNIAVLAGASGYVLNGTKPKMVVNNILGTYLYTHRRDRGW